MKYKIIKLLSSLFFTVILLVVWSVEIKAQNTEFLNTPDIFNDKYCKESLLKDFYNSDSGVKLKDFLNSNTETDWMVYSDRDQNRLYDEADYDFESNKYLSFMEPLFVKKVDDVKNWLLVVSAKSKKELGWVPAKNLLLSNLPANITDKGVTKKGMVLVSAEGFDDTNIEKAKNQMKQKRFYSAVSTTSEFFTGKRADKFTIFYVLKEDNKMLLLSQTDKLNGDKSEINKYQQQLKNIVWGWIPKYNITLWPSRVCLEPNYGTSVYNYYKSKGNTEIFVFGNKCEPICKYCSDDGLGNYTHYVAKKDKVTVSRLPISIMRMPIIEYNACPNCDDIVRVASIASVMDPSEIPEPPKDLLNLNYIFVVDATESMKPYLKAVKSSITQNIANIASKLSKNVKFGLVVYRDYADGEKAYETFKLQSKESFIKSVKGIECQSKDNDRPEAQYQGIIKGLNEINPPKTESNIVIIIGDAGNHANDTKYKKEQVIEVLNKYNASLISFQTYYKSDDAYRKYNSDIKYFIKEGAIKYSFGGETYFKKEKSDLTGNTKILVYKNDKSKLGTFRMFAYYTHAEDNVPMKLSVLEENIKEAVLTYLNKTETEISIIEEQLNGNKKHTEFSKEFGRYLGDYYGSKFRLEGVPENEIPDKVNRIINYFKNYDGDLSVKALTKVKYNNSYKYPNYIKVVFLSENEKNRLVDILSTLLNYDGNINKFKDALINQIMTILGEKSSKVVAGMTLNEAWEVIFNIPFKDKIYGQTKLKDINKPTKENHDFYDKFADSVQKFTHNSYERDCRFQLANQYFYWIPLKDFPGYE